MKGNWEGFYRLRLGNRIIFTVDFDSKDIEIYAIGFRGDVTKNIGLTQRVRNNRPLQTQRTQS